MIHIGFCDDESSVLDELAGLIDRYQKQRNLEIGYTAFCSPWDLLSEVERGTHFDILFLDVIMPGETGIHAAAEIRNFDQQVKIIFLTTSAEYAIQSYDVDAYYYQLKPICEDRFFKLMDEALDACEKEWSDSLVLRCKSGITRIELRKLEYCEVVHRTLYIYLNNGRMLECTGSLDELNRQLEPYGGFLRPHRSYLVNLDYIQSLTYQGITMSCQVKIPIPRGKYHEIKDIYLEHAFQKKKVVL